VPKRPGGGAARHRRREVGLHQGLDAGPARQGACQPFRHDAVPAAEVEGQGEAAPDVRQAVEQALGHFAEQEVVGGDPGGGAIAVASQDAAVEDFRRLVHRRHYGAAGRPRKGRAD
jgi:hypothetical protein